MESQSEFSMWGRGVDKGPLQVKSFAFALRVVQIAKHLQTDCKEYVLSRQVLRSGASIGAMVREAQHSESKADFTHKMSIALKEANETRYWLELLHASEYLVRPDFETIRSENDELLKLLTAIVKSSKPPAKTG